MIETQKPDQKTTSLELRGVEMGLESPDLPKGTSRVPTKCRYIYNFIFLAQFGGEIGEEQHFFEVKKRGKPHISPPN